MSREDGLDDICLSGEDRMALPTSAALMFSAEDTNLSLLLVYYVLGFFSQAI